MKDRNRKGISLVETIVYLAVLTLILIIVMNTVLRMGSAYSRVRLTSDMERSAAALANRIGYEIKLAQSVNIDESFLGTSTGKIVLESGSDSTLHQVTFQLSSGEVKVSENSQPFVPLTVTKGITVESLMFHHIDTSVSEGVRWQMTLRAQRGTETFTRTYSSASVLKNSY